MKADTRRAFLNCIFKVAAKEDLCEKQRQKLCNEPLFNPYHVFMRLSYQGEMITAHTLQRFAKEKSLPCTLRESSKIVEYFGCDAKIDYSSFLQMILPTCNSTLRSFAAQKEIKNLMKLDSSLEYSVQQLIARELEFHRTLEFQVNQLCLNPDFSVPKIFVELRKKISSEIEIEDLSDFIKRQKLIPNVKEIIAFVRRIDQDADGKLSYNELCDAFTPFKSKKILSTTISYNPVKSPPTKKITQSQLYSSQKPHSASFVGSYKSPYLNKTSIEDAGEILNFSGILKQQVMLEKELELSKETISLKSDFNLFGGFKLIDREMKGYATIEEVKLAFKDLGIIATDVDLRLLFNRYNKNKDDKLRYSEFCVALIPKQKEYALLLNSRTPISQEFSLQTRVTFKSFINTVLQVEREHEMLRNKVNCSSIRLDNLFKSISKNNLIITADNLEQYLEDNGYLALAKDIGIVLGKYDRDEDGKISFNDFCEELQTLRL